MVSRHEVGAVVSFGRVSQGWLKFVSRYNLILEKDLAIALYMQC